MNFEAHCGPHNTLYIYDERMRYAEEFVCVVEKCVLLFSWQIDGKATWIENIMP